MPSYGLLLLVSRKEIWLPGRARGRRAFALCSVVCALRTTTCVAEHHMRLHRAVSERLERWLCILKDPRKSGFESHPELAIALGIVDTSPKPKMPLFTGGVKMRSSGLRRCAFRMIVSPRISLIPNTMHIKGHSRPKRAPYWLSVPQQLMRDRGHDWRNYLQPCLPGRSMDAAGRQWVKLKEASACPVAVSERGVLRTLSEQEMAAAVIKYLENTRLSDENAGEDKRHAMGTDDDDHGDNADANTGGDEHDTSGDFDDDDDDDDDGSFGLRWDAGTSTRTEAPLTRKRSRESDVLNKLDIKRKARTPRKAAAPVTPVPNASRRCSLCGTNETRQWRRGPNGTMLSLSSLQQTGFLHSSIPAFRSAGVPIANSKPRCPAPTSGGFKALVFMQALPRCAIHAVCITSGALPIGAGNQAQAWREAGPSRS